MSTLIGIKKGDLHKIPVQVKKTWKEANNGYLICQEYDKIQPNEWFKISDKIQEMEIDFSKCPTDNRGLQIGAATFLSKRLETVSSLPKILLGLGVSYILINNVDEVLEQKVKIKRFGSKSLLYPEKKKSKKEKAEIKKETFFKKTKSQKIKVKEFLGFYEGIKT